MKKYSQEEIDNMTMEEYDNYLENYGNTIVITEEEYKIAADNGIDRDTVRRRVRKYLWDTEKAITTPIKKTHSRKKWVEIAVSNGISSGLFYHRLYNKKWSLEDAATKPKVNCRHEFPQWVYDNLEKNGITRANFLQRLKREGMTWEEASTKPVVTPSEKGKHMSEVKYSKKVNYPKEVWETCRNNGISSYTFKARIKRGWSIERAMTTPVKLRG